MLQRAKPPAASPSASDAPVPYYKRQQLFRGGVHGGPAGGDIISEAARWGRLDALRFLRAIDVPWPSTGRVGHHHFSPRYFCTVKTRLN
jgi:hypothetical protein